MKAEFIKAEKGTTTDTKTKTNLSLTDILEGYKKVMRKYGVDTLNENHYYSMMVKLSINQKKKTWRECLKIEK